MPKVWNQAGYMLMHRRKAFRAVAAVTFASDYMARGADYTGIADGKTGLVSFWFLFNGGDATRQMIYATENAMAGNFIQKAPGNSLGCIFKDVGNTNDLILQTATAYTADATWHHVAFSWDVAIPVSHVYVDGGEDEDAGATENNDTLIYSAAEHMIGAEPDGSDLLNADIAELYINLAEYLDISQAANLQKLRTVAGKPAALGSTGELVTGTTPLVYHTVKTGEAATVFATNKGSGGDSSITGTLTLAPTSPSD